MKYVKRVLGNFKALTVYLLHKFYNAAYGWPFSAQVYRGNAHVIDCNINFCYLKVTFYSTNVCVLTVTKANVLVFVLVRFKMNLTKFMWGYRVEILQEHSVGLGLSMNISYVQAVLDFNLSSLEWNDMSYSCYCSHFCNY